MKLRIAVAAAVGALGCTLAAAASASGPAAGEAGRIDMAAFAKEHDAGRLAVLDVRGEQAYQNGHIPGALSFPGSSLEQRRSELEALGKPIVTYCS